MLINTGYDSDPLYGQEANTIENRFEFVRATTFAWAVYSGFKRTIFPSLPTTLLYIHVRGNTEIVERTAFVRAWPCLPARAHVCPVSLTVLY